MYQNKQDSIYLLFSFDKITSMSGAVAFEQKLRQIISCDPVNRYKT